ncbi:LysR family transcriptional regulator [Paenibacillus sp. CGMCC 1.16610]|uniref:LysR family transcriptional regulator n=1 Tax=Paenibacillus anseongense TaxID=2682845 RepID=A0ABW9UGX5_9BACL|nr:MULTISPECIES: LysR family transcriptional regulator [Paenibacillus]MBA2939754.1 LysR family transcriptional regulator [Paenibacillus sp. CGMCC 1.16610]MVQ39414.1 LysR family transcriptional regulator [Paenibacillus anseongense]
MEIEKLEAFLSVCQTLNFTKASKHLHVSQSAITARIKALESTLDTRLFFRDKRTVRLTEAGITFLPFAERMFRLFNESKLSMSQQFDHHIVLGGHGAGWQHYFFNQIVAFRKSHPKVAIKINSYLDDYKNVTQLLDGTIHIALRHDPPNHPKVSNIFLFEDEVILVSAEKGLVVSQTDFFTDKYCHVGNRFPDWFPKVFGHGLTPALELDDSTIITNMLLQGGLFGFLTKSLASPFIKEEKLFIVQSDFQIDIPNIQVFASFLTEKKSHINVRLGLNMLGVKLKNED